MISTMKAPLAIGRQLVRLALGVVVAFAIARAPGASAEPTRDGAAFETAMDAVLVVRSDDAKDRFLGSAFLWGEDGLVAVTNAHVVAGTERVRLIDRHGEVLSGEVIARDELRDVAVISLPRDGHARHGLVASPEPAVLGQPVFALGAPLGIEFTLTEGLVSAVGRQVDITRPLRLLQHDAAVNPGSSGGPLVDGDGRLLGMNSRIADGSRVFVGIAYAIAAADLERIVNGLIDETLAPFPHLGLTARPVDRKVAEAMDIAPGGLLVDAVAGDGRAAAAGLNAGDVIIAAGGETITEPGAFAFAVEAAQESGAVTLEVLRGATMITLVLPLGPEPALSAGIGSAPDDGLRVRSLAEGDIAPVRIGSYSLATLGVALDGSGMVDEVKTHSPAIGAGLVRGDRILAVNGRPMDADALAAVEISEPALLLVEGPGGQTRHVYLDPWTESDTARPVGGANVLDPAVSVF